MSGHVYCYHYTTGTKPGKWAVMCIVTITLPVQSQDNERSCVLLPLHYCAMPGKWAVMGIVTITLPMQSQVNDRSCVLLPLHYLYKANKMSGHVCCYHYTTCIKPCKWAVMCIVTITLPVQSQENERHVHCYHYTTCTKPGKWAFMCIVTITLPVQSKENERACVLLPLLCMYKAREMNGHVYCYHYTACTKPGQWAIMCIVTITLPVQSQENERICVLLPLLCMYEARKMSGHVYCYHYSTCTKPCKWAFMCIVTITLPVQSQENERSGVLLPLH